MINMNQNVSRRDALFRMGAGIGTLGLLQTLQAETGEKPHFLPRAKRVIHLFMNGGPSQVDTFNYCPELAKYHGQPVPSGNLRAEPCSGNGHPEFLTTSEP